MHLPFLAPFLELRPVMPASPNAARFRGQAIAACLVALGIFGCQQPTVRDILAESATQSGIRKIESANHVLTARYLAPEVLLLGRAGLDGGTRVTRRLLDSLRQQEDPAGGWTFLLTLSPAKPDFSGSHGDDVVYGGKSGFGSYREAMAEYHFGWQEKIWIEADGVKIPLANYQMENTFGMNPSRNFTLMFPAPGRQDLRKFKLVLDGIVPGMAREKIEFEIRTERYATSL